MIKTIRLAFVSVSIWLAISCLKETPLPIAADFSISYTEGNMTSPVSIEIDNLSYGADRYEWTFEGGNPSVSGEKNPGVVVFSEPGDHRITLKIANKVDERTKEMTVHVDSAVVIGFDVDIQVNDISPADVLITNRTTGGSTFKWTFEGGEPSESSEKDPGIVRFAQEGEHKIKLVVGNGSRTYSMEKSLTLRPGMKADFDYEPLPVDMDMEAPLTLKVRNLTENGVNFRWDVPGATITEPESADSTFVRFLSTGRYAITLTASDGKREERVTKEVVIRPNSGILIRKGLRFGISEARNTVGCFYSVSENTVLTSDAIEERRLGGKVDFGFFGLNSSFEYCYFFSPSESRASAFPPINGAKSCTFVNNPEKQGITIDEMIYDGIVSASGFDGISMFEEPARGYFTGEESPHYVLLRTGEGRRGIIRINEFHVAGSGSYIMADLKIEKQEDE